MFNPTKSPVRLTIAYGLWSDDWSKEVIQRFEKAKHEYIDISDLGTGRMSKRMAENFVIFLKNAIVAQIIPVPGLHSTTVDMKGNSVVGVETSQMLDSITAFRSNLAGEKKHRGYLVGIKEKVMTTRSFLKSSGETSSYTYPTWYKLSWLEFGTKYQVSRPIIARGFELFVGQGWVKKVVEDMISRGVGMTAAKSGSRG